MLYWMGAGILLLLAGVAALVMLMPAQPKERPAHERSLLWIYDAESPSGPAIGLLVEESHQLGRLTAVLFPAPEEARAVFQKRGDVKRVQQKVAELGRRQVHHRLFLPYQVVEALVNGFGFVEVEGRRMDGPAAVAYIREDAARGPERAYQVLMAVSVAAGERQPNIGVSEGLRLAGQIDTDLDLMAIPEVLGRWNGYGEQQVVPLPALTAEAVDKLFQPDPVEPAEK
ncbi:MAG: hypothetical protein ACOY93_01210 [Bacillota bacterium]